MRLAGKIALVTGAGRSGELMGVGAAIAARFAAEGAQLALLDMSAERAQATADAIVRAGGAAHIIAADITRHDGCVAAIADCVTRFGGLDVLVNNAAIYDNPSMAGDEAAARRLIDVNVFGTMNMTEAAHPAIAARGGGAIVNIGSITGLRGYHGPVYSASKGAVFAYTRTMAHQLGRAGIRVNAVAPGHIVAPQSAAADARARRLLDSANLLGTGGSAADIADAALFLASDEARWITGVVLPVDGGLTATTPSGMAGPMFAALRD